MNQKEFKFQRSGVCVYYVYPSDCALVCPAIYLSPHVCVYVGRCVHIYIIINSLYLPSILTWIRFPETVLYLMLLKSSLNICKVPNNLHYKLDMLGKIFIFTHSLTHVRIFKLEVVKISSFQEVIEVKLLILSQN